jgi:hypothetical protein
VPDVDAAVADLADLTIAPLSEHHDRLARAHAALNEALTASDVDGAKEPGGRDDPARP